MQSSCSDIFYYIVLYGLLKKSCEQTWVSRASLLVPPCLKMCCHLRVMTSRTKPQDNGSCGEERPTKLVAVWGKKGNGTVFFMQVTWDDAFGVALLYEPFVCFCFVLFTSSLQLIPVATNLVVKVCTLWYKKWANIAVATLQLVALCEWPAMHWCLFFMESYCSLRLLWAFFRVFFFVRQRNRQ